MAKMITKFGGLKKDPMQQPQPVVQKSFNHGKHGHLVSGLAKRFWKISNNEGASAARKPELIIKIISHEMIVSM